ncbi:MAG: DUF1549 and DUF1553 domain-containing protein [Pirellulales bacterium]|nr:DUF1549 and DUF1553 domain-containing protein [Pirellulales bacterium]
MSTVPDSAAAWRAAQPLTALIDQELAARWQAGGVTPAELASDAEFLRRVYLDLAGRIPSVSEARDFLEDESADRRQRLVDRLLVGPAFANHFARTWRAMLLPEADANLQVRFVAVIFEAWLRKRLREGLGYDALVRELLTVPLPEMQNNGNPFGQENAGPISYYFAKEGKPENLAASTARALLGVRLECAQCHDHPFAHWKQDQFWQLAGFFSGIERQQPDQPFSPLKEVAEKHELKVPDTERTVSAAFLDGTAPEWTDGASARGKLAEWITARGNPLFARALANRLWAHFFGIGLVDPVDDFDEHNQPSHPALLAVLAAEFSSHDFRWEHLIRAITSSRAYQLSSAVRDAPERDPRQFAAMPVRGLSAEQLFDSLALAIGFRDPAGDLGQFVLAYNSPRATFLETFANQRDRPLDYHTSIIQAMALMNGQVVADATAVPRSWTLGAVANYPGFDDRARIETLYLATLSRPPRDEELARLEPYLASGGARQDRDEALGDILWALLNSSEFLFNH